jgi:hypothetical protein
MPVRRLVGRRITLVLAAAIAMLLMATMVVASHDFTDVPSTAYYHDAVSFLKDHGITAGCSPSKYCPNDSVKRGDMAIFVEKTAQLAPTLSIRTEDSPQTITGSTFVDVTGASVLINVPPKNTATLLITFSAESVCYGGGVGEGQYCSIQILVDQTEAFPEVDDDFAFDSDDDGTEGSSSWEAHSMQRTLTVGPGDHAISVQGSVQGDSATFGLDDWTLSVQRYIDLP